MRVDVISLFPEFLAQSAALGVVGRAQERGLLELLQRALGEAPWAVL